MKKKLRKIPTAQSLAAVALHYLGRYAASEASLRRVLTNRLRRAALQHPAFAADAPLQSALRQAIEQIIAGHKRIGVVNDARFAETKVDSLRRQGRSRRAIEQKLAVKGIASETIRQALAPDDDSEAEEVEMKAALALARRRKLGPFRKPDVALAAADSAAHALRMKDLRRRDMAVLARAGYAMGLILKVLNLSADEAPEDEFDYS